MAIPITDFFHLRQHHPVVDVRSQGEFTAGHIRGAINIPLLNNEERVIVGTTYKQRGQHEAIKEGFKLVGPRLEGIIDEAEKVAQGNEILVHCWRGGMRSNNFCQFMGMAGIKSQSVTGGYKAYRQVAFDSFKRPLANYFAHRLHGQWQERSVACSGRPGRTDFGFGKPRPS